MKKKVLLLMFVMTMGLMTMTACGSSDVADVPETSEVSVEETEEEVSEEEEEPTEAEIKEVKNKAHANSTEADKKKKKDVELFETTFDTNKKTIEDSLGVLAEKLPFDFNGDVSKAISEYKDMCLSADDQKVNIERKYDKSNATVSYIFTSENGKLFETAKYEVYPDTVERFCMLDIDDDKEDEVLLTSNTYSTGGWLVTYADLFDYKDGKWKSVQVYDYEKGIKNDDVNKKLTGVNDEYECMSESYFVRDILLTEDGIVALTDKGMKDGALVSLYYAVELFELKDGALKYTGEDNKKGEKYWAKDMSDSWYEMDKEKLETLLAEVKGTSEDEEKDENKEAKSSNFTCQEISIMAEEYYKSTHGQYAPMIAYEKSEEDGIITLQLFEDVGDHIATWEWYYIDPATGTGENLMEEKVDLTSFAGSSQASADEYVVLNGVTY